MNRLWRMWALVAVVALCSAPPAWAGDLEYGVVRDPLSSLFWSATLDERPPLELRTYELRFKSGLRVVVQPYEYSPVVAVTAVVGAGTSDVAPDDAGLAHLAEHLWFRSRHEELPETTDLLRSMGCRYNATTSFTTTDYTTVCPKGALPVLLRLEARRLTDPLAGIDAEIFDVERDIVRSELRYRFAGSASDGLVRLRALLYPPSHPYARPYIGTDATLASLDVEGARSFTASGYRPPNTTLYIAGNLGDDGPIEELLLRHLPPEVTEADPNASPPDWSPRVRKAATAAPDIPPEAHWVGSADVDAPHLYLGWTLPGGWRGNGPTLDVVAMLAAYALEESLPRRYADSGLRCSFDPEPDGSALVCAVRVDEGEDRQALARRLLGGLHRGRGELAEDFEVFAERWMLREARHFMVLEAEDVVSLDGRIREAALRIHHTGSPRWITDKWAALKVTDGDTPVELFAEWVTKERAVVLEVDPLPQGSPQLVGHGTDAAGRFLTAPPGAAEIGPWHIKQSASRLNTDDIEWFSLPNGLRVVIARQESAPRYVTVGLAVATGSPDAARWGVDASHNLWMPTGHFWLGIEAATAGEGWRGELYYVHRDWLDPVLRHVGDLVLGPPLRPKALSRAKAALTARSTAESSPSHTAYRDTFGGELPRVRRPLPADLDLLLEGGRKALTQAARDRHQPSNTVLAIVGDVDPDEVAAQVREMFQSWVPHRKAGPIPRAVALVPGEPVRRVVVDPSPGKRTTQVRWTCRLPQVENAAALEVAEELVRRGVWQRLRADTGWAYVADAHVDQGLVGDALLHVFAEVPNERVVDSLAAIAGTVGGTWPRQEVLLAAYGVGGDYAMDIQTGEQVARELVTSVFAGRDLEWHANRGIRLGRVGTDEVGRALEGCVDRTVTVLEGPGEELGQALDAAGLEWSAVD